MVKSETIPRPMHPMLKIGLSRDFITKPKSGLSLFSDLNITYLATPGTLNTVKLIDSEDAGNLLRDKPPDRLTTESLRQLDEMLFQYFSLNRSRALSQYPINTRSPLDWHNKGLALFRLVSKGLLQGKSPRSGRAV